jgi:hypothetical protein
MFRINSEAMNICTFRRNAWIGDSGNTRAHSGAPTRVDSTRAGHGLPATFTGRHVAE